MTNFETSPVFNSELRMYETTDPAHADIFNTVTQKLINNDVFLFQKNGGTVDVRDFGAKVDGVTDDTEAIRDAIAHAEANRMKLFIPGVSVITGELEIKKPLIIEGAGAGAGYGDEALTKYFQISGFLVKSTGAKRVRTRRLHRSSATSPQDSPLSAVLNVQAENVVFRDFTVFLDFDKSDVTPTNYGADWDVGIFVGCRTHFFQENVHVLGYFREAGWWYDVTHATNLPRFNALDGTPYDNTNNISGADGCTMIKCFTKGAKWGIRVAGALPAAGYNDHGPQYYDEILGTTTDDYRGTFGFSDFATYSCSIYGTDHHSNRRRNFASGNYLTDTAGGAMWIDGLAGNSSNALQGNRHFSTRFASFEPFKVRLDRANRSIFIGCHIENRSGDTRKNPDGSSIAFDDTDTYGPITCTTNTNNVITFGLQGAMRDAFIPTSVRVQDFVNAGSNNITKITDIMDADYFRSATGLFQAKSGEFDGRSGSDTDSVRLRKGSTTSFLNTTSGTTLFGHIASDDDGIYSLGNPSKKFGNIYAASGTINTSDERLKENIAPSNLGLDFINMLNPVSYKFKNYTETFVDADGIERTTEHTYIRPHYGLIAQEVKIVLEQLGIDFAGYVYDQEADYYAIRYMEFIAPLIKSVQELSARVTELESGSV